MALSKFENLEPEESRPSRFPKLSSALARCRRVLTVEPVALLYFISYIAMFVTNEQYVYGVMQQTNAPLVGGNASVPIMGGGPCDSETQEDSTDSQVEAESAKFLTIYGVINEVPGILLAFFWGSYTDSRGRKPAMIIPLVGALLRVGCQLIVTANHFSLNYLLIGAALDGFSGGPAVIMSAVFAYIADVTSTEQRSLSVIILQSMVIVGLAVSQLGVGFLIASVGYLYTLIAIAGILVLNLVYVMAWLKESITQKKKASFFSLQNVTATLKIFFTDNGMQRRWKLLTGQLIIFIGSMIDIGGTIVIILFILAPPLCFTSVGVGIYQVLLQGLQALGVVLVLVVLLRVVGDLWLVVIGCVTGVIAYLYAAMPFINQNNVFFVPVLSFMTGGVTPLVRSMMTKCCEPHEQGALSAGVVSCIQGSQLVGTALLGLIYAHTVAFYSGLVFIVAAGCYAVTLVLAFYLMVRTKQQERLLPEPTEDTPIQNYRSGVALFVPSYKSDT